MKKTILIISAIIMVAIIAVCISAQEQDAIESIYFTVDIDENVSQRINLFNNDGIYYVFLPSYTKLESLNIAHRTDFRFYLDGNNYSSGSSFADITLDRQYTVEIKNIVGTTVCKTVIIFMKGEQIPSLSITLVGGTLKDIHNNKEESLSGYAAIIEADKTVDYWGELAQIHGRGNSSWGMEKKPYALEFSEDTNLLNMGAHRCYVLVANAMDESNLRNKIVYDTAVALGLPNSVNAEYVDLYVNGDYLGLYLLTSKISILENNPSAIDLQTETQKLNQYPLNKYQTFEKNTDGMFIKGYSIEHNPQNITGSYLLEFELSSRVNAEKTLFTTRSGQNITVKVPKYASEEQMDYISAYVQSIEDSLGTTEISTFIDTDSWERYYLIQEIFSNISKTSFFFHKNGNEENSILVAGPVWDFDLSMGTNYENENSSPYQIYCNWGWFEKYNSNEYCMNRVIEKYQHEVRPLIQEVINSWIDSNQSTIEKSYLMNEKRWESVPHLWWVNQYNTQEEHSDYLKTFLSERLKYLDYLWLGTDQPQEIVLNIGVESESNPAVIPSFDEKVINILNNKQHYSKYGLLVFSGIILFCVVLDMKDTLKARRRSNG